MNKIYIFGHQKPDTDSVTAAITLSYLKNAQGMNTEPRCLGDINEETKFVLNKFKVKAPKYINDVRLQLKDINYHKKFTRYIKDKSKRESLEDQLDAMKEKLKQEIANKPTTPPGTGVI